MKTPPEVPIWQQLAVLVVFIFFLVFFLDFMGTSTQLGFAFLCGLVAIILWQFTALFHRND